MAEPLVVACLAPADLRPEVDPLTGAVATDWRRADLPAGDQAALELALRAGDAWGMKVLALAAGPAGIDDLLRDVRALGPSVLRVAWPDNGSGDPATLAGVLATAMDGVGDPRLVLCGQGDTGAVPAFLAAALGAAQALGLVALAIEGDPASGVVGERRLDGGWREQLRVGLPAVCSVEAAGLRLRRASLGSSLASAGEPVPVVPAGASVAVVGGVRYGGPRPYRPRTTVVPAPEGSTRDRLLALTGALATHDPPRLVGPVGPAAAVDELLAFLNRHGYGPAGE